MRIIFFHPNQDVCEFISNAVKREKTMQAACGKLEDLAQQIWENPEEPFQELSLIHI